jgi:hypothetical protein
MHTRDESEMEKFLADIFSLGVGEGRGRGEIS